MMSGWNLTVGQNIVLLNCHLDVKFALHSGWSVNTNVVRVSKQMGPLSPVYIILSYYDKTSQVWYFTTG